MELKQYLSIARRWAWLLIVGLTWGAAGGFFGSSYQTPVYQASTRALVMRPPLEQSSDMTYYSDLQLVQTYIQLLTTQPVLDAASARLGYHVQKGQIKITQTGDTHVLVVTIEDKSPQRAAQIANVLIEVMIEQNELLQKSRFVSTETSIQAQITQVEDQINSLQLEVDSLSTQSFQDQLAQVETQIRPLEQEVSTLQQEIASLEAVASSEQAKRVPNEALVQANKTQSAEKQARIEQIQPLLNLYQEIYSNLVVLGKPVESGSNGDSRMTRLQATLELYQSLYINLVSSLETVRLARLQNTPNIVQIEPASVPNSPIRPRPLQNTALAAAVGLMLAAGIVFLLEYLDDTLKTPEDVQHVLGLPVLGFVAQMPSAQNAKKDGDEIFVIREPRSPVTEAFRTLRTNLEFAAVEKPICTLLVTSPGPSEGKTTVAANLAVIYGQAKKRVLLLDADMRRPRIHRMLGMSNRNGLSNIFLGQDGSESLGRSKPELPNLLVVTSGGLPPNPAELLGSAKMDQILSKFHKHVDVVIIDTPPSLVADAQILAGKVDAVLLVIQPGKTHAETARACLETLNRSGARIVGVVMNRIPRNRSYYYGGYQYYASHRKNKDYYSPEQSEQPVEEPVLKPAPAPAPAATAAPAREPAPGPLQRLLQAQSEASAVKPDQDTKPSARRQAAEPEETYPDESYLSAPSVHKLFDDLNVAPNAAPRQADQKNNSTSSFRWTFPADNPGD